MSIKCLRNINSQDFNEHGLVVVYTKLALEHNSANNETGSFAKQIC